MRDEHSYDPATGHGLPHNPLKAIIAPRPIGWISTLGLNGVANLAPYSFFNIFSENPPILFFSSGLNKGMRKDTIRNIAETGEFAFNLATKLLAQQVNKTSAVWPAQIDEFEEAGLEKVASDIIRAPRVAASPVSMECKLIDIRPITDINGHATNDELVTGQVVRIHISKDYLTDGHFDLLKASTIARAGYRGDFVAVTDIFEMLRPPAPPA